MSVEHLAVVLHHSRSTGTAKLILVGIANHQGDGGAWPAVGTLAKYANCSPRNVQMHLEKLVNLGEVRIERRTGSSNRYQVLVSCPAWCDKTPQHRDTRKRQKSRGSLWKTTPEVHSTPEAESTPTPEVAFTPPLKPTSPEPSTNHQLNAFGPDPTSTTDRASEATRRAAIAAARVAIRKNRNSPEKSDAPEEIVGAVCERPTVGER